MKRTLLAVCFSAIMLFLSADVFAQPYIKWQKSFGNVSGDCCGGVDWSHFLKTSDGNIVASGAATKENQADKTEVGLGYNDPWVIKISPEGKKIWDRVIRDSGDIYNDDIKTTETADGGYILCAISTSDQGGDKTENSRGEDDYWVIKLSASGEIEWDRTFGGSGSDRVASVIQTSDGNYLVCGTSSSGISGDRTAEIKNGADCWVVKFTYRREAMG